MGISRRKELSPTPGATVIVYNKLHNPQTQQRTTWGVIPGCWDYYRDHLPGMFPCQAVYFELQRTAARLTAFVRHPDGYNTNIQELWVAELLFFDRLHAALQDKGTP